MNQILMLNAAYMPVGLVSWMRAICLLVTGKAEVLVPSGRRVSSPTTSVELPSILRLVGRPHFRRRGIPLNRKNLLARDEHTCQYCLRRHPASRLNMDHVIPRSQGGVTRWDNIATACIPCNDAKGPRTPEQAGMRLLRKPFAPQWTIGQEIQRTAAAVPDAWKLYLPVRREDERAARR